MLEKVNDLEPLKVQWWFQPQEQEEFQDEGVLEVKAPTHPPRCQGCIHDHLQGSCIFEELESELEKVAGFENCNTVLMKKKKE